MNKNKLAFLKALSAIVGNISAAWFGLAFITPNFTDILTIKAFIALTKDIILGILFFVVTIIIERILQDDK